MGDRNKAFPVWVPLFFGLVCLTSVLTKARISTYHVPDLILLIMGGFLLGVALTGFVAFKRARADRAVSHGPGSALQA
jgi:hypothetical protein